MNHITMRIQCLLLSAVITVACAGCSSVQFHVTDKSAEGSIEETDTSLTNCEPTASTMSSIDTDVSYDVSDNSIQPNENAEESNDSESNRDMENDAPEWYAAEHVFSHRGASGEAVEHTFAAYDLAIEYGSHYIEQDLVLSKEGTLYVSHDDTAERIAGVNRRFDEMTNEEINQLRTANGEKIHTLQEVFDRYRKNTTYVIELKDGASQVNQFVDIIQSNGMESYVIVQDFDAEPLEKLETIFPDMPKLRLCREESDFNNGVYDSFSDIICVKYTLMTQENCDKVHTANKLFAVYWSGGASEDIESAIRMGVDYYFTNYTKEAIELELAHNRTQE